MMDESLRAQRDASITLIDRLISRGRELSRHLTAAAGRPAPGPAPAADAGSVAAVAMSVRLWQHDCAALVSQLAGGNKSHWLSRAYSEALLVPQRAAGVGVDVPISDIIARVVAVLERATAAMSQAGGLVISSASEAGAGRRFDFVREPDLRPVLERAYRDSRQALENGSFGEALLTSCGILEAIITEALVGKGSDVRSWTFEERIAAAEREGLIRGGCARLPAAARRYRDANGADTAIETATISERDARVTGQVLHVIMRDLDPGR
jgi:hypothetical protein